MCNSSRPYQYRYRPYDYRENQIREESRTRQKNNYSNEVKTKRKQICFNDEEIEIINDKMRKINCDNFNQFITVISLA